MVIVGRWTDPAEAATHTAWVRRLWSSMQPYASDEVYVNYMAEEEGDRIRAAYGPAYDRLAALKATYDPTNLFHGNQNIKPA
jgi:FAD/FMN-containing dehydrogenase